MYLATLQISTYTQAKAAKWGRTLLPGCSFIHIYTHTHTHTHVYIYIYILVIIRTFCCSVYFQDKILNCNHAKKLTWSLLRVRLSISWLYPPQKKKKKPPPQEKWGRIQDVTLEIGISLIYSRVPLHVFLVLSTLQVKAVTLITKCSFILWPRVCFFFSFSRCLTYHWSWE